MGRQTRRTPGARLRSSATRGSAVSQGIRKLHVRIVIGAVVVLVAMLLWVFQLDGLSYVAAVRR